MKLSNTARTLVVCLILSWNCSASATVTFAAGAKATTPLAVGAQAPAFSALTVDGSAYGFNPAAAAQTPKVIIFYRGGWCPFCNVHLSEMRESVPKLQGLGYEVLFLSSDRHEILRSSLKEEKPES